MIHLTKINSFLKGVSFTILVSLLIAGCSSPDEKISEYIASGNQFIYQEEYLKAGLQFRNALQIDNSLVSAWYGLSQVEQNQGNIKNLLRILNKILDIDPSHVKAHIKLGNIYLVIKQIDKALIESNKAMELAPYDADVRAFRAAVLLQLSDDKGAIREAKLALDKDPGHVDALLVLALERLKNNDPQTAVDYLDIAIEVNKSSVATYLIKIKALGHLKDSDGVIKTFKQLVTIFPEKQEYKVALARYFVANKQIDEGESIYRELIASNQDNVEQKLTLIRFLEKHRGADVAINQIKIFVDEAQDQIKLQFSLATLYLFEKRLNDAVKVYNSIIERGAVGPNRILAQNRLAVIFLNDGDVEKAKHLINEMLKNDASNIEALLVSSTIDLTENKTDRAIISLRTILNEDPNAIKALILLARAHSLNSSPLLAREYYQKAIQLNPTNQKIVLEYVNILQKNRAWSAAEDVLRAFLNSTPNSISGLQAMAQVKLTMGDWLSAYKLAKRIEELGDRDNIADQILGVVYQGQKQYDQSIEAFKRAYATSPLEAQPLIFLVRTYVDAGKKFEAQSFLKSVLSVNPSNIYALIMMGDLYILDNDLKNAEISFKLAIEANPKSPIGYQSIASFYSKSGQYSKALSEINRGLNIIPDELTLLLAKTHILELTGKYDRAIKLYEHILSIDPDLEIAVNNLASLLTDHSDGKGDLQRALHLAKRFEHSAIPHYLDTLGWIYYKLDNPKMASSIMKMAVARRPEVPIFHYHLGMSLYAQGELVMAKSELEKAVTDVGKGYPGIEAAKMTLGNMQ